MVKELSLEQCDVKRACAVLKVSRSGYYDWQKRPVSKQKIANEKLGEQVIDIWKKSRETYGLPRIFSGLHHRQATTVPDSRIILHVGQHKIKTLDGAAVIPL